MKTYIGQRPADEEIGDCRVFVKDESGETCHLRHVVAPSPAGFEWGYGGSGPADTALSILADFFDEQPTREQIRRGNMKAWAFHQPFKWQFISPAPYAGFTLTEQQISDWLGEQEGGAE